MEYAQLNEAGTVAIQVTTHGNVEWDDTHFCPAVALTPDEAAYFRVVPLTVTEPPAIDAVTQSVIHNGCEKIAGLWRYKWDVIELYATQSAKDAAIAATLHAARLATWERIKAKRDTLSESGGYSVTVSGTSRWFHSDPKSKTQQMGLVMMGAAVPPVGWKTMSGVKVTMTQTLAGQIFAAGAAQDMAIFAAADTHRTAMEGSADPSAYDFSGGWPVTYTEGS